jgi:hypothetical protein
VVFVAAAAGATFILTFPFAFALVLAFFDLETARLETARLVDARLDTTGLDATGAVKNFVCARARVLARVAATIAFDFCFCVICTPAFSRALSIDEKLKALEDLGAFGAFDAFFCVRAIVSTL